jgi:hypothetical protein
MGRPPSLTPAQQKEAISRRAQGATLDELARSYNVSRANDFAFGLGGEREWPRIYHLQIFGRFAVSSNRMNT